MPTIAVTDFFDFLKICIFVPTFYQIFETGLSAQSHKQHGCHASAISGYTLAEQKVSNRQLIKVGQQQAAPAAVSISSVNSVTASCCLLLSCKFHYLGYIYIYDALQHNIN